MKHVRIAPSRLGAAALAAFVLAGCAAPSTPSAPHPAPTLPAVQPGGGRPGVEMPLAQCDAAPAQFAVGQAVSGGLVEDARRAAGAPMARVLRPGQVVTMEFNDARLNLNIDASGVVVSVKCG